jgi:hypothetical protein
MIVAESDFEIDSQIYPRCTSGKIWFGSEQLIRWFIWFLYRYHHKHLYCYYCQECGQWHLTSREQSQ